MTTIFKPAGDANGVTVAIPEADAQVYVDATGFSTDDELVIAVLDTNPAVVRASAGTPTPITTPTEVTQTPAPATPKEDK